jgi:ribosomal-protein-alanine N-acetyltransferase
MSDAADIQLQPLGPLDRAVAAALHARCFDDGWSESAMAEILAMPGCVGAVAHVGDRPVGLVIALAVAADAEIVTLGVLPEFRRHGIGGRLLAWAADRSRRSGCRRLLLEVAEDNPAARALYGKLGFSQVGRRPSYYRRSAGTAAAMVLARNLDQRMD